MSTAGDSIETSRTTLSPYEEPSIVPGQFNLFTGELERVPPGPAAQPEEAWLFDPDFGLVLPDDPAGKEVLVEPGIALQFPVQGLGARPSGSRKARTPNLKFDIEDRRSAEPRVAKTEDGAQLILSGFGIYLGKKSERLQIKVNGKVAKGADGSAYEFPFFRISEVVIALHKSQPDAALAEFLDEVAHRLMDDLREKSKMAEMNFEGLGKMKIQCIYPKASKAVIDDIDRVLAEHYRLSDEELDFIVNYDIKYRMGREAGEDG